MGNFVFVIHRPARQVLATGFRSSPAPGGSGEAGVSSFNTRTGPVNLTSADVSEALGYTPPNSADLADVALSGAYADLSAKPIIPALPGDIGAATAAQGAAADTAVQPAALASSLAGKVDKSGDKVLSDENYTSDEKSALASLREAAGQGGVGSGGAVIIGTGYPDSAPPSLGAHYLFDGAFFVAIGTTQPEHWVQLYGYKNYESQSVTFGGSVSPIVVGRMTRLASLNSYGTAGNELPAVPIIFPEWRAKVEDFTIILNPVVDGLVTRVDLDFGSSWSFLELFVAETMLFSPVLTGTVISLSVSQCVRLSFVIDPYEDAGDWKLHVEITAEPLGRLVWYGA